jgi:glycine oxidase
MVNVDVVIAGNGVLGLSLGFVLAKGGHQVAVLGSPQRPGGASAAAGAMLGCFGEVTAVALASEPGRRKHKLAVAARALWAGWLDELVAPSGNSVTPLCADGTVVMLNTVGVHGIDDVNYGAIREALIEQGEPFEDVEPGDVAWLDPDPRSRPIRAMFLPGEHAVDAAALLNHLGAAIERFGGLLIGEQAVRIDMTGDRVTGVTLGDGSRVAADRVVIAAGAASQDLLDTVPEAAARIPRLVSGYGVSALVGTEDGTAPASVIRTPNRAFACGLHLIPRGAGEVYAGATNVISPDLVTTPMLRDVVFLLTCAMRQIRRNLQISGAARIQVGNRPVPLDGFPLLGPAGPDGLYLMTGTYRDGLHMSPLLAPAMAKLVLDGQVHDDIAQFTPVRPPIVSASRSEIIETTIAHMLATGYEQDWVVPVDWPEIIESNLRLSYARFAAGLDPYYTPPPEILAASRASTKLRKLLQAYYQDQPRPDASAATAAKADR